MFDRDFKDLLSVFDANAVEYLIIGGYAVSYHAQPRATKDLDLWISAEAENARAVHRALAAFGAPLQGIDAEDFTDPDMLFRMGRPPLMVDILPTIAGGDFKTAWEHRVPVVIDPATGLRAWFISRRDLLAAKMACGRPQDLADVAALREAEDRRPGDTR
jgi:hypothetical protein